LDPDLEEGYLYEFVVEFSINLHSNIYFRRGSILEPISMYDFSRTYVSPKLTTFHDEHGGDELAKDLLMSLQAIPGHKYSLQKIAEHQDFHLQDGTHIDELAHIQAFQGGSISHHAAGQLGQLSFLLLGGSSLEDRIPTAASHSPGQLFLPAVNVA